jgi:transposase
MWVVPKTGKRLTRATRRRTNRDFARQLRRIATAYRKAKRIHLVIDNLSSHSENACIETFGERKGRSLWRRFKVHFTPKHGSWLNAAEMEASLLSRQCLGRRRIPISRLWCARSERGDGWLLARGCPSGGSSA